MFVLVVLAALSPFVQRYIALLPMHLQSRIVKWKGPGHVYYSTNLYIANEGPYCHLQNPHNGGMSTFFQPPLLRVPLPRKILTFLPTVFSCLSNKLCSVYDLAPARLFITKICLSLLCIRLVLFLTNSWFF
jgi:hypothetical protein